MHPLLVTNGIPLIDQDLNKNTFSSEDLTITNATNTHLVPTLQIGSPLTVSAQTNITSVTTYSKIGYYTETATDVMVGNSLNITITTGYTGVDLLGMNSSNTYFNFDFSSFTNSTNPVAGVCLAGVAPSTSAAAHVACSSGENKGIAKLTHGVGTGALDVQLKMTQDYGLGATGTGVQTILDKPFVADIFSFKDDGTNNAIYRLELSETADGSGTFEGTVEYVMLNQINKDLESTYTNLATVSSDIGIIVEQDMTDEDSPRINYYDLGADQLEAPTHSGVVSFDSDNYKIADTVVVTLDDQDMNTDSSLIDVYTTNSGNKVGGAGSYTVASPQTLATGLVLDITFDDTNWNDTGDDGECSALASSDGSDGLEATGFTLVETGTETGIFTGSFQVPTKFCYTDGTGGNTDSVKTVTGTDIEVNYQDFRNASGESIEVGDGASINANTGSVAFDRTGGSIFLEHSTAANTNNIAATNVTVHVRVTDADYNVSAMGEDTITDANVTVNIERGSNVQFLTTYGNTSAFAPNKIVEVSPDSGVFEADIQVGFDAGPTTGCPAAFTAGCILQGDIITVEYTDNYDASGKTQTVTDSATFDLRNGVLQADKSVYLIGSDMILTLIEPDFDTDNDGAQSLTLDLIEWDSDAGTTSIQDDLATFDPEPSTFRETGDSTGIFQVVLEIPAKIGTNNLDRGEKIDLEYTDWGPAGADYVGQEGEDIGLTVYTSNFGATKSLHHNCRP